MSNMNQQQKKLIHYCYDLLARRRYSIKEMVKRLEDRNHKSAGPCTDDELQQVLAALVQANLLNDRDFATFYLDSQMRKKPVGKAKIRFQLRKKGLDEEIISQVLNLAEIDELAMARQLLAKKVRLFTARQLADRKTQARLMRYLATNGFRGEICYQVLKDLCLPHQFDLPIF